MLICHICVHALYALVSNSSLYIIVQASPVHLDIQSMCMLPIMMEHLCPYRCSWGEDWACFYQHLFLWCSPTHYTDDFRRTIILLVPSDASKCVSRIWVPLYGPIWISGKRFYMLASVIDTSMHIYLILIFVCSVNVQVDNYSTTDILCGRTCYFLLPSRLRFINAHGIGSYADTWCNWLG